MVARFKRIFEAVIDQITILQLEEEINGLSREEKSQLELLRKIRNVLQSYPEYESIRKNSKTMTSQSVLL